MKRLHFGRKWNWALFRDDVEESQRPIMVADDGDMLTERCNTMNEAMGEATGYRPFFVINWGQTSRHVFV